MRTTVKIYQIKDVAGTIYAYRSYNKDMFKFEDYKQVAKFNFNAKGPVVEHDLERIFEIGNNGTLHELYEMRSISVSDVIEIDNARFYVQSIGFKLLEGDK